MGFVCFILKQPPLQMKIHLTDSDRNVHRRGHALKVLFTLPLVKFADFLPHFLTDVTPEVSDRQHNEAHHSEGHDGFLVV